MRAVIHIGYGQPEEVLTVQDIPVPEIEDEEVLVKVQAASVHADVWHAVTGMPYAYRIFGMGLFKPRSPVPGTDLSGVVESVGKAVKRFKPGDEVFGESHAGVSIKNGGAYAEYSAVPEKVLVHKPAGISFEQAAAIPTSGNIGYLNLRAAGQDMAGQKILINGAGGSVGSIALQLARAKGAEVTAVDNSEKVDLLRKLGADHVIDYTHEDIMRRNELYDRILDVASTLPYPACKQILKPDGIYMSVGHYDYGRSGRRIFGDLPGLLKYLFRFPFDKNLPKFKFEMPTPEGILREYKQLVEAGKFNIVIDRTYSLSEVPEALQYLVSGKNIGRLIIVP